MVGEHGVGIHGYSQVPPRKQGRHMFEAPYGLLLSGSVVQWKVANEMVTMKDQQRSVEGRLKILDQGRKQVRYRSARVKALLFLSKDWGIRLSEQQDVALPRACGRKDDLSSPEGHERDGV